MRSLLAFVLFIYIADCKQFRSDYNYHSEAKGWLKLHRMPATFHDAWLRCRLEGAVLASPSNKFIESAMRKEIRNQPVSTGGVFTGIHATFSKGDFFSIEGIPLKNMQLHWMANEPDNKNNEEDCILYNANKIIADIRCSEIHPYICYKENTPNVFVTGCGTVDHEYNLDKRTGKCYKFHTVARNWTRAFMTCSAEGGHLAIVNNATEADVLKELFAKYPSASIKNAHPTALKDYVHIGFHDWNEIGVWTTVHGTSLSEAGYELWGSGLPNNAAPGENCGSLNRYGQLNDIWCDKLTPFICEKNAGSLQDYDDNFNIKKVKSF